jgi:hypothetical protein
VSARRWGELAAKAAVPVLAVAVCGYVLVEPPREVATAAARAAPVAVPLESAQLVCPGPETIGVRGADADRPRAAPAAARVAAASPPDEARPQGAGGTGGVISIGRAPQPSTASRSGDGPAVVQTTSSDAAALSVAASGGAAPGLVAEQVTAVLTGDERGLSSATCLPPSDDQWLVGGGTDVGRRGRLVLANPHEATADVTVDVLSADGAVRRTPGSTVAVAPHSRVVLLLDALAPGATSPVIHVRSTGGSVGAVLSDTWLEGTTPRGIDDVVASVPPAKRVVVPGVLVDGGAFVRVAVPGDTEAVAQLRVIGQSGVVDLPDGGVVRVPAGSSRDVSLAGVPAGAYGVEVVADVPVVAGALVARRAAGGGPGEFAWSASSGALTSLAGLAVADSSAATHTQLVLTAPRADAHLDLLSVTADGATTTTAVDVPSGTTRVVAAAAGTVWVRPRPGSGDLVAARFEQRDDASGPLVTAGPLRQVALTRVPIELAPADR